MVMRNPMGGQSEEEAVLDAPVATRVAAALGDEVVEALTLITQNGGNAEMARSVLTPGMAVMIVQNPSLARTWAERFPAASRNQYGEAEVTYGFAQYDERPVAISLQPGGVLEGLNGMVKFENGVIAGTDPSTGEERIIFDPSNPDAQGSPQWLQNVASKWGDKQISKWRKRLSNLGYISEEEGGWAEDLRQGLRNYYQAFYLNHGKPVRYSPKGAGEAKTTAKDIFHPAEIRGSIREVYNERFGEDPTPDEIAQDSEFVMQVTKKLLKKGVDPGRIPSIVGAKYQEAFDATPQAKLAEQEEDDIEAQTEFRDGLMTTAELIA